MHYWMVRAGEGGKYFDEFIAHDMVALGWEIQNLNKVEARAALETIYRKKYPKESKVSQSINS